MAYVDYITTDFKSRSNSHYLCKIQIRDYAGAKVGEVKAADTPLILVREEVEPVIDRIQSTQATLSLFVHDFSILAPLLTAGVDDVRLQIYEDGRFVWSGYLDTEGVEDMQDGNAGQVVSLRFGDFKPLKQRRFVPKALTLREAVNIACGAYGLPVKWDYAHLPDSPDKVVMDTTLLGDRPTLYDLLGMVANATSSTVRMWGAVSFFAPSRARDKASTAYITHLRGEDGYIASAKMYNSVEYRVDAPAPTRTESKVSRLEGEGGVIYPRAPRRGDEQKPTHYYLRGRVREGDHSYDTCLLEGYAVQPVGGNPYQYALMLTDAKDMYDEHSMPSAPYKDAAQYLNDAGSVVLRASTPIMARGGAISVSCKVGLIPGIDEVTVGSGKKEVKITDTLSNLLMLQMPAAIYITDSSGKPMYSYSEQHRVWVTESSSTPRPQVMIKWSSAALHVGGKANGTYNETTKEWSDGLDLPQAPGVLHGARLVCALYSNYAVTPLWGGNSFGVRDSTLEFGAYKLVAASYAAEPQYHRHRLIYGLELGQKMRDGDVSEPLEVTAVIDDGYTETATYESTVSTARSTPAWMWVKTDGTNSGGTSKVDRGGSDGSSTGSSTGGTSRVNRGGESSVNVAWTSEVDNRRMDLTSIHEIGGKTHEDIIISEVYTLYGNRGKRANITVRGLFGYYNCQMDGRKWLNVGGEYDVRKDRHTIALQTYTGDEYISE